MGILIKKHWLVIAIAVIVSLLYGGDHLLQIQKLGWQQYEPTTVASDLDAAVTYYPRAKAVFEGDGIVGDINLAEYTESPAWMSILNPIVMGNFAKLFGSMKLGVIVSDFLFPPIIFLLFYGVINLLTRQKFLSLVAATFFIFGPGLPFWEFTNSFIPPIFSFPFNRIDWPKATMILYLLAAILTFIALRRRRNVLIALAGFATGALFYTDLYDWVSFYTGMGLLLIWFLATRARDHAKIIGSIIAIGLAVSIGYWMNFLDLTNLSQYQDIVTRVGVERSHGLRFFTWGIYLRVAVVAGLLWLLCRKDSPFAKGLSLECQYLTAFILPIFVTLNLQVITGINPQPDHWMRPLIPFMYGALALIALGIYERYLKRIPKQIWTAAGVLALALLFAVEVLYIFKVGERGQMHDLFKGANTARAQHLAPQYGVASYRWIRENLPAHVSVAAFSPSTNLDLQIYTSSKLFLPYGLNTIAPNKEVWQRFFYLAKLYAIPDAQLKVILLDDKEMGLYLFQNMFYSDELNAYFKGSSQAVPLAVFDEKVKRYGGIDVMKPPFKLEYVYFGPNERTLGAEDPVRKNTSLEKVYEDESVSIYKL